MPRKNKSRRLWLQVKFKVPKGVSQEEILRTLIASIRRGDYEYPKSWHVIIRWKNKLFDDFKAQEFTEAMEDSAESSRGWDSAVTSYLERKLQQ
jgi:hypothetical protein